MLFHAVCDAADFAMCTSEFVQSADTPKLFAAQIEMLDAFFHHNSNPSVAHTHTAAIVGPPRVGHAVVGFFSARTHSQKAKSTQHGTSISFSDGFSRTFHARQTR
jgi:hypothetical protein